MSTTISDALKAINRVKRDLAPSKNAVVKAARESHKGERAAKIVAVLRAGRVSANSKAKLTAGQVVERVCQLVKYGMSASEIQNACPEYLTLHPEFGGSDGWRPAQDAIVNVASIKKCDVSGVLAAFNLSGDSAEVSADSTGTDG